MIYQSHEHIAKPRTMLSGRSKSVFLTDNRPKNIQRKVLNGKGVIQLVARTKLWSQQEAHYQSNKVGKKRISGDALWLAMVRFSRGVKKLPNDTVQDVLNKAAKKKGLTFEEWKGSGKDGTLMEAQHLVSSSYATKTLKWPYWFINSVHNGKMLMAGRKTKGIKIPKKYIDAKKKRGKVPRRGLRHITKGIAHPGYDKKMKIYVQNYYKKNNLVIGSKVHSKHMRAITKHLRKAHRKKDRMKKLGVNDLKF